MTRTQHHRLVTLALIAPLWATVVASPAPAHAQDPAASAPAATPAAEPAPAATPAAEPAPSAEGPATAPAPATAELSPEERQRRADADKQSDRLLVGSYILGGGGIFFGLTGGGMAAGGVLLDSSPLLVSGVVVSVVGVGMLGGGIGMLVVALRKRKEAHGQPTMRLDRPLDQARLRYEPAGGGFKLRF